MEEKALANFIESITGKKATVWGKRYYVWVCRRRPFNSADRVRFAHLEFKVECEAIGPHWDRMREEKRCLQAE